MSEDTLLPKPVRDAQLSQLEQRRYLTRTLVGTFAFLTAMMVAAFADAPDVYVAASLVGMLGWFGGHMVLLATKATDWQRSHKTLEAWDNRQLASELDQHAGPVAAPEPEDPRWASVRTLVDRIRELAADDPHTVAVAQEVLAKLRGMTADLGVLRDAIEADAALGAETEAARARAERLQTALDRRSATADRLVEAIRDLHVELAVRDASSDPIVDRLESLLAQVEAESELAALGSAPVPTERTAEAPSEADRRQQAQRAARQQSTRSRE